jgi:hypothetical protein
MVAYVITARRSFLEEVESGLKTGAIHRFEAGDEALRVILQNLQGHSSVVLLDLATVSDAVHLITFLKSSPSTRSIPIVSIGTAQDYDNLQPEVRGYISGMLHLPCTAEEIARTVGDVLNKERSE